MLPKPVLRTPGMPSCRHPTWEMRRRWERIIRCRARISLSGSYHPTSSGVRSANTYQSAIGNIGFLYNQYELLDFGLKKATVRNAEAFTDLSQADLERERYLVKWEVGKLYLEILKNEFQLGIDSENVIRYETLYTVIQAVTRSGIKPGRRFRPGNGRIIQDPDHL